MGVSHDEFEQFQQHMEDIMGATQADIDALTGQVGELATLLGAVQADVATATATVAAELERLQSGLDVSALQAAVAPLAQTAQAIDDAVKALAPAPAPAAAPAQDTATLMDRPVYVTTEDPSTVAALWSATGFETVPADGSAPAPLFYYAQDTAGDQTANGQGLDDGAWSQYQGPIQPVPAS